MIAHELFARGFERAVYAVAPKSSCRLDRVPDSFDGKSYSIDSFYDEVRPHFANPAEFFGDFGTLQSLREVGWRQGSRRYEFATPIPSGWAGNDRVPFKWFRGDCRTGTILLFVPGWARPDQRIEEAVCRRLARQGIDMLLLTAPFHQSRAPAGSFSGEYFISHNLFLTVANFRQFVAEIRQLVRFMRDRYVRVGLIGLSSGGFQAGLASLGEAVDFLFPVMTGCELGRITWSSLLTRRLRHTLKMRGITEATLSKAWAITDMAVVGSHCRARYCKQYITRYDGIIPVEFQERLWEVYGRPDREVLDASHYSILFYLHRITDDVATVVARG